MGDALSVPFIVSCPYFTVVYCQYCFKHYIKVGKACGPDKIASKELQMFGDVFIDNFLNIAKKSFDDRMFP